MRLNVVYHILRLSLIDGHDDSFAGQEIMEANKEKITSPPKKAVTVCE